MKSGTASNVLDASAWWIKQEVDATPDFVTVSSFQNRLDALEKRVPHVGLHPVTQRLEVFESQNDRVLLESRNRADDVGRRITRETAARFPDIVQPRCYQAGRANKAAARALADYMLGGFAD